MSDEETRVTFGDAPGNSYTVADAGAILRGLHERNPEYLGWLYCRYVLGVEPKPAKRYTQPGAGLELAS